MNGKTLYDKHKDVIPYLFFGACTTAVNVISYWIVARLLQLSVSLGTIIAWVLAVLFAYVTNRKWVFHSTAVAFESIIKEMVAFFTCRLATGLLDLATMYIFVEVWEFPDVIMKFISNILVIILNYLASKMVIFREIK